MLDSIRHMVLKLFCDCVFDVKTSTFFEIYANNYEDIFITSPKIVSAYDQENPQSQIADKLMASQGRATQKSGDTRKTNCAKQPALSS